MGQPPELGVFHDNLTPQANGEDSTANLLGLSECKKMDIQIELVPFRVTGIPLIVSSSSDIVVPFIKIEPMSFAERRFNNFIQTWKIYVPTPSDTDVYYGSNISFCKVQYLWYALSSCF